MNLPEVIHHLVAAQAQHDAAAYADCFAADAAVADEGHTYQGKTEIQQWIAAANEKYHAVMAPLEYSGDGTGGVLKAKVSGTFEGSPIVLSYHFKLLDGLIQSLRVSG